MFIAEKPAQFKNLFVEKLKAMLSMDELGAFILVLANSRQDVSLSRRLEVNLKQNFVDLKRRYEQGLLTAAEDDLDVFRQLLEQDIHDLPVWQTRQVGDWEINYNAMRALRPARSSAEVFTSIKGEFNDNQFHFNKPFLKPEILWEDQHEGFKLRVLYNKFPFSPYHLLIVVSAEEKQSQYLNAEIHQYVCSLVDHAQNSLPGFGVAYNSFAAGASVNHLHFQGFIREATFPLEQAQWRHNGGDKGYPVNCFVSESAHQSWQFIEQLHQRNQAYNCLYRKGRYYILPRAFQGTVALPEWLKGCGWLDLCGVMTVSDKATFTAIDEASITQALALLKV